MLNDNFVTMEIGKAKHIALVAHDGKKKELVDWCDRNKEILKGHFLCRLEMYRLTGTKCMRMCRVILQWMLQIVRLKVIKNTSMYNM